MILCIIADCLKKIHYEIFTTWGQMSDFLQYFGEKRNRDVLETKMLKKIKLSKTYPLCILLLWWPKLGTYESVWSNCYPKGFVLWIWNCGWQALIDSPKILGCQKPTAQILTQALPKKPKKIGEILWTIHTGSLILNGNLIILMKLNWAQ